MLAICMFFFGKVVHVKHVESQLQIAGRCSLWNVGRHEGSCFAGAAILKDNFLPQILRLNKHVTMGVLSSVRRVELLLLISESAIDFHTHSKRLVFEPFRMSIATDIRISGDAE
jgi:hypothetical protein